MINLLGFISGPSFQSRCHFRNAAATKQRPHLVILSRWVLGWPARHLGSAFSSILNLGHVRDFFGPSLLICRVEGMVGSEPAVVSPAAVVKQPSFHHSGRNITPELCTVVESELTALGGPEGVNPGPRFAGELTAAVQGEVPCSGGRSRSRGKLSRGNQHTWGPSTLQAGQPWAQVSSPRA